MKAINNARATFLYSQFHIHTFDMNICHMIQELFASEPSLTVKTVCNGCKHSNASVYPLIKLNDQIFSNDFSNMEIAIMENLPINKGCSKCKNDVEREFEFGPHLFIEVGYYM